MFTESDDNFSSWQKLNQMNAMKCIPWENYWLRCRQFFKQQSEIHSHLKKNFLHPGNDNENALNTNYYEYYNHETLLRTWEITRYKFKYD